ncbi:hypothetical protein OXX80_000179 [Metschnikowia pulcherrima]
MSSQERTVNIGIETAANALRKFLNSGDSPADCTAILSTINSELQSMASSSAVQTIVQNFLESDLLSSACEVWNQEKIPNNLDIEISGLFHLVTQSIFEGCGDLNSGLQYRDSHTNKLVCLFYHNLYKSAIEVENPRLICEINLAISEKLVAALAKNPNFVLSFFDHHSQFLPYTFFVKHISVFFESVARCLTSCRDDRYLQAHIREHLAVLVRKVTWGDIASLWDSQNAWKLLFFSEVLQGNPITESVLLLFESFLHSIDSWKVLFEVCLYFLNMVPQNPSIDAIIAESTDTRMVLVMKNAVKEPLSEQEKLVIWDFIGKVVECSSFDLILGLFYEASVPHDKDDTEKVLRDFRKNAYRLMSTDVWFVETFTNCLPNFCRMSVTKSHCNVEWSAQKSLSCFIIAGIKGFLENSIITNRFIYSTAVHLLGFDCTEVVPLPLRVIKKISELLKTVDAESFIQAKQTVIETDGICRKLNKDFGAPSADDTSEERPLTELERKSFKLEGMRQNFFLLEALVATVYAAIRAKQMARTRHPYRETGERLNVSPVNGDEWDDITEEHALFVNAARDAIL